MPDQAENVEPALNAVASLPNPVSDLAGRAITQPWAPPELTIAGATAADITDNSSHALIAAQAAGVRIYITDIEITNSSSTATSVSILDGATLLRRFNIAANGGISKSFARPMRGSPATALNVQCGTSSSGICVNASGFTGVE